jgi:hypothetical protein
MVIDLVQPGDAVTPAATTTYDEYLQVRSVDA